MNTPLYICRTKYDQFGSNKDDWNQSVQQPLRILRIFNDIAGTTRNFMESSNTINVAVI